MYSNVNHRYRGHRANSFRPVDVNELIELRARQRTFHGAYSRTALGNLGYALTILRLFDSRFYRIGIVFTILAGLFFILALLRSQHSKHDFADYTKEDTSYMHVQQTVGQEGSRIFGRPFVTAGWIVVGVSCVVVAVEISLLVLILQM